MRKKGKKIEGLKPLIPQHNSMLGIVGAIAKLNIHFTVANFDAGRLVPELNRNFMITDLPSTSRFKNEKG